MTETHTAGVGAAFGEQDPSLIQTTPEELTDIERARLWSINSELAALSLVFAPDDAEFTRGAIADSINQSGALTDTGNVKSAVFRKPFDSLVDANLLTVVQEGVAGNPAYPSVYKKTPFATDTGTPFAANLLHETAASGRDLASAIGRTVSPIESDGSNLTRAGQLNRLAIYSVLANRNTPILPADITHEAVTYIDISTQATRRHVHAMLEAGLVLEYDHTDSRHGVQKHPVFQLRDGRTNLPENPDVDPVYQFVREHVMGFITEHGPNHDFTVDALSAAVPTDLAAGVELRSLKRGIANVLYALKDEGALKITVPAERSIGPIMLTNAGNILAKNLTALDYATRVQDPEIIAQGHALRQKIISPNIFGLSHMRGVVTRDIRARGISDYSHSRPELIGSASTIGESNQPAND